MSRPLMRTTLKGLDPMPVAQHVERREQSGSQAIAVMIGQLGQGGSERQLYMFLAHCDRARWAPTLYVSGEIGFWETPIRALGIPVVLLVGSPLMKMRRFRAASMAQKPACFFSWSSYTNIFGLTLLGTGTRRIGSFRNAVFADLPRRFRAVWSWASLTGISVAVCNSRETFEALAPRIVSSRKAVYVPNGVEMPPAEQVEAWRREWRGRLGLAPDDLLVVGVGRLAPQKCFARFIDVIAEAGRTVPLRAAIAGDDLGCLADLQGQVARLKLQDTVSFVGKVPDARALICAADIFLLTSDHEGMPNVVLEALSAGVPCVVTRVNSIDDLVEHGETGFVADRDVSELAAYVTRLAGDEALRRSIGAQARLAVGRRHDPGHVTRRLWQLCEQPPT